MGHVVAMSRSDGDDATLRDPPWSQEAEQGVLGCLLQDASVMALVLDLLVPQSFYAWEHRAVFQAILDLLQERRPVDVITVFECLGKDASQGNHPDGLTLACVNSLALCVANARNVRAHAEIVAERAAQRDLIAAAEDAAKISWDDKVPLADRAERINGVFARVEARRKNPGGTRVPLLKLAALQEIGRAHV